MSSPNTPEKPGTSKKTRESVKEMKKRKKKEMEEKGEGSTEPQPGTSGDDPDGAAASVPDPYDNAVSSNFFVKRKTGIAYDAQHVHHKCVWDNYHPENPHRASAIMDKLRKEGVLDKCLQLDNLLRTDLFDLITMVHTKEHYERLRNLSHSAPGRAEHESRNYDSVYFTKSTFEVATRAVSSVCNLVEAVARREIQNGMAIVRPPGHHAMRNEYNGYCFFNNVAIAAEMCLKKNLASKILIIDVDVHHGQGVQRHFYKRKDVLYVSIHRYEHGNFWPHLFESNFNFIGEGEGVGFNINIPLNSIGLSDEDYFAILFSILLPISYEFNPDLVILAAGYDACIGCPEGRMKVTPGFYSHLVTLLSGIARGQLAVCLEGGYFISSMVEAACQTVKGLLGAPCPLLPPIRNVHPTVVETICNVRRMLMYRWKCFRICEIYFPKEGEPVPDDIHHSKIIYAGIPPLPPYPTRKYYSQNSQRENCYYSIMMKACKEIYHTTPDKAVFLVYDDFMLKHCPKAGEPERPERPERLTTIMDRFKEFGIIDRVVRRPIRRYDFETYDVHSSDYYCEVGEKMTETNDIYVNEYTSGAVDTAVSGVLCLMDSVMYRHCRSGVALVRPPGHHAEYDKAMGFCFINNVAIGAKYLEDKHKLERILIIDFDIHHGNGTQNAFYNSNTVMYISIHRDDHGKFFPRRSPRSVSYDGFGPGQGYNINIPFSGDKMGDTEYMAVFHNIILPIAYSFAPEIILVSAGFDAGINDPLGNYAVSPETFGHFIQMLKPLARGHIVLILEGGYNTTTTSYAMTICTKTLLGDPLLMPRNLYQTFSDNAITTIRDVMNHFKKYYNVLNINKKLGVTPYLCKRVNFFTSDTYNQDLTRILDADRFEDSNYVADEYEKLFQEE